MNNLINVLSQGLWAALLSSIMIDASQIHWRNIFGLVGQLSLVMLLLMSLFFLRKFRMGMLPLFVTLATFPHLQAHLAITKYVDIYQNDFKISCSVVLFVATLFMVQLVYVHKDGIELRKLCTVIFSSVGLSTYLMYLFDAQGSFKQDTAVFGMENVEAWWIMYVRLLALVVDLLVLPCVYESTRLVRFLPVCWRIFFTTLIVSWIDSLIFLSGSFHTQLSNPMFDPDAAARITHLFWTIGFGNTIACTVCSLAIWVYFELFQWLGLEYKGDLGKHVVIGARDLLKLFFYMIYLNNDYESIRRKYSMDQKRQVFMSQPFDSEILNAAEYSERSGNPTCLVIVDVEDNGPGASRAGERRGAGKRRIGPGVIEAVEKMVRDLAVGPTADASVTITTTPARAGIQPLIYVTNVDEIAVCLRDTSLAEGEKFAEVVRNGIGSIEGTAAEGIKLSCGVAATDDSRDGRNSLYTMVRGRVPLEWRARMALDRDRQERLDGTRRSKAPLLDLLQAKPRKGVAHERLTTDDVGPAPHDRGPNRMDGTGRRPVTESGPAEPALVERTSSPEPDPTWEMVAVLEEEIRKKDQRIHELESIWAPPPGSSLVMEEEYLGFVNDEGDKDVEVVFRLTDDEALSRVYLNSQFNREPPPSRNDDIIVRVKVYKLPATTDDEALTDYELHPREKINDRIKT